MLRSALGAGRVELGLGGYPTVTLAQAIEQACNAKDQLRQGTTDLIFPGAVRDKPLSDMAPTAVMRRMKLTAVPHGFRSTFSDWCAERTATPAEVREMALAHAIGNDTEEAYRRGDLIQKRRDLMELWSGFIQIRPTP